MSRLQSGIEMLAGLGPAAELHPAPLAAELPAVGDVSSQPTPDSSASPPAGELQRKLLEMIRRNEALRKAAPR